MTCQSRTAKELQKICKWIRVDTGACTRQQTKTLVMLIESIWPRDARANRYILLKYLFGEWMDSCSKLSFDQATWLIDWITNGERVSGTNIFVIQPRAIVEANACLRARLKEQGQLELFPIQEEQ